MSNIISETIDTTYPVAGIDNDTQGFRDNFSIIKAGIAVAASEISQLQENTAKLNESNDFNGTTIADADLSMSTQRFINVGTKIAGDNISFLNGHYQLVSLNINDNVTPGSITFNLADWPNREGYAKITVELRGTGGTNDTSVLHDVLFTSNSATIKKSASYPATLQIDSVINRESPVIIEFWTTNQGNTVYANYLGVFA